MMKRVLFAIPAKGGLADYWLNFMGQLATESMQGKFGEWAIDVKVESANHILSISRDVIAEAAMNEDYDKVIMCDADHPITTDNVRQILSHDVDMVGALYPGKKPGKIKFFSILSKGAKVDERGLVECDFMGTGLVCIDVDNVLRRIAKAHPDREYQYDKEDGTVGRSFEFFPVGLIGPRTPRAKLNRIKRLLETEDGWHREKILEIIAGTDANHEPGRKLGEDYGFCFLARTAECKLYADTKLVIPHEGKIAFPIIPENVSIPSPLYGNNLDFSLC